MSPMSLAGARLIADRFELERLAEEGGMGKVWRAVDRVTGDTVAVKVLAAASERAAERFRREALVLAELAHPAIVRYVAHGVTGAGEPWLAMEWLDGEPLSFRLRRSRLTVAEVRELGIRLAEGLAAAHDAGVIHRDLKPGNVYLVDREPRQAVLVDFGVARFAQIESDTTRTGDRVGTPRYMAPEQVRAARTVDWRCDLWSLGCVLYTALAGRPPFFASDELAIWAKILLEEPAPLPQIRGDVPAAMLALIRRLLEKSPAHRPASAQAVADELRRIETSSDEPITSITEVGSLASTAAEQRRLAVVMIGDDGFAHDSVAGLAECALRHGGHFEALSNGAALITFAGSPAATDLVARASRCALDVRGVTSAPIAVASGRGVTGGAPAGEAIDRAAAVIRIAARRGRRAVAVDEVTAGLLGTRFAVDTDGGLVWLVGERSGDEPIRAVLGKRTPTVGRDRELLLLTQTVEDCSAESAARAVIVVGDAGIGKTRLRLELLERLGAREPAPRIWLGRGDPGRAGAPFGLAASALRWRCGIHEAPVTADERAAAGQLLRAALATLGGGAPGGLEVDRLETFLAELIGAPLPASHSTALAAARQSARLMSDQMRRAWLDALAADLRQGPVVIVLDDLHWGDQPSVELIDDALRGDRPLAVVAFARPDVAELFPKLWGQRHPTQVRLGPLSRKAALLLVRDVLGTSVRGESVDRVVELAAGNALYLEELIRAAGGGATHELPETVVAMVQVRLEALPQPSRMALRAASVFGTSVRRGAISSLLGGTVSDRELDTIVADLVDREILTRSPERDDELHFGHDLIRDAAYGLLLDADRSALHRAAGHWLEAQREREALTVAHHLELGGDLPRAGLWYRYAAEQALDAGDPRAVLEHARRGLGCGAPGSERALLQLLLAEAHDWLGASEAAEDAAIDAMDLAAEGSSTWLRAAGEVAVAAGRQGNLGLVASIARHLLRLETIADRSAYVIAAALTGCELLLMGRYDLGRQLLVRIEVEAARSIDGLADGWRLRLAAIDALVAGDLVRSLALSDRSAAAFERVDARRELAGALVNIAFGTTSLGRLADAESTLRRVLTVSRGLGMVRTVAVATQNLALTLLLAGRPDEALALAEAAEGMAAAQGARRVAGAAAIYQVRALLAVGRNDDARDRARRAVELLGDVPPLRAYALAVEADALLALGDPSGAAARARRAVELIDALTGVDEGEAYARWILARALAAAGEAAASAEAAAVGWRKVTAAAAAIGEADLRRSFVDALPEHAGLRGMAGAG